MRLQDKICRPAILEKSGSRVTGAAAPTASALAACSHRSGQHFRKRDCGGGEQDLAGGVCLEDDPESCGVPGMPFELVINWRRVYQ